LGELVNAQQEDIDAMESNVNQAKQNVESGTTNLEVAKQHQDAYRRKQCYALICITILLVAILAGVCGSGLCTHK